MYIALLAVWLAILGSPVKSQDRIAINYTLLEEQPSGTIVGNIIVDGKLGTRFRPTVLNTLTFSFLASQSSSAQRLFSIGSKDGVLRTKARIDRDRICAHEPSCKVILDIALKPVRQVIKVTIDIKDLNDNWPKFSEKQVYFDILESTLAQTSWALPSAQDLDSQKYGVQKYELITNAADAHKFELKISKKLDGSTDVKLVLKRTLDREVKDSYLLKVVAMDGGSPAKSGTLNVHIRVQDVNDNRPVFSNSTYVATVYENMPVGTVILKVVARDPDINQYGTIKYGFSSRTRKTVGRIFGIRNRTGEIYTKAVLDYEKNKLYQLSVLARDQGQDSLPAFALVNIEVLDLNDNRPVIDISTLDGNAVVSELASPGTWVAMVSVEDKDAGPSGNVSCTLLDVHFKLEKQDVNEYHIVTATSLDREQQDRFLLTVRCSDKGIPPKVTQANLNVTVSDENDNAPIFEKQNYLFHVFENTDIGTVIGKVSASDADKGKSGEIFYTLGRDAGGNFDIDIHTGTIVSKNTFDHEKADSPVFTVIATDKGVKRLKSRAKVTVNIMDRNDNDPVFSKAGYTFGVDENEPPGTEVGKVYATDVDSSPYNDIEYSLIENGNDSLTFAVETLTGVIRTRKVLDWEKQIVYHLYVKAHNRGHPDKSGTATVTIFVTDKNDNKPVFVFPTKANNSVQIPKEMARGYHITVVKAADLDSDEKSSIRYFIADGNVDDLFVVDQSSGVLTTADDVTFESDGAFRLRMGARDGGYKENVVYEILELVVNASLPGSLAQTRGGLSTQNIIILVSVMCIFAILALALVIGILTLRRNERNKNHMNKYNCRIETIKALSKKSKHCDSNPYTSNMNSSQIELSNMSCLSNGTNGKPKKEVSFCLDADPIGKEMAQNTANAAIGMRTSWPSIDPHALQNPVACSSLIGNSNLRLSQIEMQQLHQPDKGCNNKDIEVKLMHLLKKDQDADSSCSGEVSNTDSGRGASEEGETIRVNCAAHSFDAHQEVPATNEREQPSYTSSNQVVPEHSYFNSTNGSHGYNGNDTYHDNSSVHDYGNLPMAPKTNRTSSRDDLNNDSAYNDLGSSYLPMQVSRSQWQQKTPEGSLHPRVVRHRERMKNQEESVLSDMCDVSHNSSDSEPSSVNYSCSDISSALNPNDMRKHSNKPFVGVKLAPVPERSVMSDGTGDDVSSTSGSYVVNPQDLVDPHELQQEINKLFFTDMVV